MGKYFNPATKEALTAVGRPVGYVKNYEHGKAHLKAGEVLVGLFDRGNFKIAPVLPDAEEFEYFMEQYNSGMLLSCDFFAVPEASIP
jgi:hypothetical protein